MIALQLIPSLDHVLVIEVLLRADLRSSEVRLRVVQGPSKSKGGPFKGRIKSQGGRSEGSLKSGGGLSEGCLTAD